MGEHINQYIKKLFSLTLHSVPNDWVPPWYTFLFPFYPLWLWYIICFYSRLPIIYALKRSLIQNFFPIATENALLFFYVVCSLFFAFLNSSVTFQFHEGNFTIPSHFLSRRDLSLAFFFSTRSSIEEKVVPFSGSLKIQSKVIERMWIRFIHRWEIHLQLWPA